MTRERRPGASVRANVVELRGGDRLTHEDRLATEEPLEIRLSHPGAEAHRLGVTMRTPGHDFELAVGWTVHERVVSPAAVTAVRYCTDADLTPEQEFNVVTVESSGPMDREPIARLVTSACGVCGPDAIADVLRDVPEVPPVPALGIELLRSLPVRLRTGQPGFERTGGLHAAGLSPRTGSEW